MCNDNQQRNFILIVLLVRKRYHHRYEDGTLHCTKLEVFPYKTDYFDVDWQLVGTFNLIPHDEQEHKESFVHASDVLGKAAINGTTVSVFTLATYQV